MGDPPWIFLGSRARINHLNQINHVNIRLTNVPAGFCKAPDGKDTDDLRLAVVVTISKPAPPSTYDALRPEEKTLLSNWPATLEKLKVAGFSVKFERLPVAFDTDVVPLKNWSEADMEEAWRNLLRSSNPFRADNSLGGSHLEPPGNLQLVGSGAPAANAAAGASSNLNKPVISYP